MPCLLSFTHSVNVTLGRPQGQFIEKLMQKHEGSNRPLVSTNEVKIAMKV